MHDGLEKCGYVLMLPKHASTLIRNVPGAFNTIHDFHSFVIDLQTANEDTRTCAQRRRGREPPAIKELRMQKRLTSDNAERDRLAKVIWEGRKHWLNTLRRIRLSSSYERGIPMWRSKKLCPISRMSE